MLVVDAKRYEGLGVPTAWISERSIVFGTRSALFSVDPLGGEPELLITFPTEMYNPPSHLAADEGGNRVLFSVVADDTERSVNKDPPGSGIWLADLGRQSLTRLTDGREDVYPIWYECVFRAMWATDSGRCGPPIPGDVGHPVGP